MTGRKKWVGPWRLLLSGWWVRCYRDPLGYITLYYGPQVTP